MSVPRGAVHAKWIVGKVIGTKMQKTAKVRVTRLVLDPYLLKVTPNSLAWWVLYFVEECSADSTLKSFDGSLQIKLLKDLAVGMMAKDEKQ